MYLSKVKPSEFLDCADLLDSLLNSVDNSIHYRYITSPVLAGDHQ